MQEYIVGIDLGGMSAKAALFDAEGKILGKTTVITRASDGFEGTAEKLGTRRAAAEKAGVPFGSVRAVGSLPRRGQQQNGRGAQMEITAGSTFLGRNDGKADGKGSMSPTTPMRRRWARRNSAPAPSMKAVFLSRWARA
ncbi:MAG: hypothetical protein ACLRSW_03090 [Christensenellaceae bacterium]